MLGDIHDWQEFFDAESVDLERLPRRVLRTGRDDVRHRVAKEVKKFCDQNFVGMSEKKLVMLYDEIKNSKGIEIPLQEFQEKYAYLTHTSLSGNPEHSTIRISLWGIGFEFPEKYLADDLTLSIRQGLDLNRKVASFCKERQSVLVRRQYQVSKIVGQLKFHSRMAVLSCFNLIEAYFNGLAWDFLKDSSKIVNLSNKKLKLLRDSGQISLREKITKYPNIISGANVFEDSDEILQSFLDVVKPFRDSLVHPSPFSTPERFGGYSTLRMLYRIDVDTAILAANLTVEIINKTHRALNKNGDSYPPWLAGVVDVLASTAEEN